MIEFKEGNLPTCISKYGKSKRKLLTDKEVISECKKMNELSSEGFYNMVAYKCGGCHKFHIIRKYKIEVLVGISGSKKSTYAHKQWLEDRNVVVISRDKIRELLFSYTEEGIEDYYNKLDKVTRSVMENKVTKYENALIKEALSDGSRIIMDSTHLQRRDLERYKYWNVEVKLNYFFCSLESAIENDRYRTKCVGEMTIRRQHQQFNRLVKEMEDNSIQFTVSKIEGDLELPPTILVDIDGTLAHNTGRSPYDWHRVLEDRVDESVAKVIKDIASIPIIICTGRSAAALEDSKKWLAENDITYDEIYCREYRDNRPDWVVKEEMWRDIAKRHNIIALIDDRDQVVNRARALGLKVLQVEHHTF